MSTNLTQPTHTYTPISMPGRFALSCLVWIALLAGLLRPTVQAQGVQTWQPTPIYLLQGDGPASPLAGQRVAALGKVTGVTADGFYLQDPVGDGDPATSDGIFVYTRRRPAVAVGSCVLVTSARVLEFYDKTELSEVSGVEPADQCAPHPIEPVDLPVTWRHADVAALYERFEGMLVRLPPLVGVVQGPTKRFASGEVEVGIVAADQLPYLPGGRVFADQPADLAALLFLSSSLGAELPEAAWGDRLWLGADPTAATESDIGLVGVLDYNFGKYQLLPLPGQPVTVEPQVGMRPGLSAAVAAPAAPWDFTLCNFNVQGLGRGSAQYPDPALYRRHLARLGLVVAEVLSGCTVIGLQETGTPADAQALADLLRTEFGLAYTATAFAGPNSSSQEFPLTNSLLTRSERVTLLWAAARQGCSSVRFEVTATGVCSAGQHPLFNRPPLVAALQVHGEWGEPYGLTVIVNHWKSKRGDESVNLRQRTLQAEHVAALVQELLAADSQARVVVLGDLNDFPDSQPVQRLTAATVPPLLHGFDFVAPGGRYSYIFNGASQLLDQMLFTPHLLPAFAGLEAVHINADYASPVVAAPQQVYHASDHDPLLLRLRPGGAGWVGGRLHLADVAVTVTDLDEVEVAVTRSDARGDYRLWALPPGAYRIHFAPPAPFVALPAAAEVEVQAGAGRLIEPLIAHPLIDAAVLLALGGPSLGQAAR